MRRQAFWAIITAALALASSPASAQPSGPGQRPDDRQDRRIARLMDELREEMWSYRQELDFFRRAPEYQQLIELRYQLRNLAIEVAESQGGGFRPPYRQARAMDQAARQLYQLTGQLEERTDAGAPQEVKRRADALRERAVEIRVLIGRLHEVARLDIGDGPGGGPPRRPGDGR